MHTFKELVADFGERFSVRHFPQTPASLYEPGEYFLSWGGKRIRPVMCLMGNELFNAISPDAYQVATAIELFHNFTLIHDDIMDEAPLRRGKETVHMKYGANTALLTGDVMMIQAYEYLNRINGQYLHRILRLFNRTAREVCEGQQLDIENEGKKIDATELENLHNRKTGALILAAVRTGGISGGATEVQLQALTVYGKKTGLAFQIADDILDVEGDADDVGKSIGKDAKQSKNTYPAVLGLAQSKILAGRLVDEAITALYSFDEKADPLRMIAAYIVDRTS